VKETELGSYFHGMLLVLLDVAQGEPVESFVLDGR
jgi:hypothetical protein